MVSVPFALTSACTASATPHSYHHYCSSGSKTSAVNATACNGKTYVYEELVGYGYLPSNARDKTGDTLGGTGSSIAINKKTWRREGKNYEGLLYALPDRG